MPCRSAKVIALGAGNAVVRGIASSWQISGIFTFRSGDAAGHFLFGVQHAWYSLGTCIPSYNPNFSGLCASIELRQR